MIQRTNVEFFKCILLNISDELKPELISHIKKYENMASTNRRLSQAVPMLRRKITVRDEQILELKADLSLFRNR